jgi:hypothetical protein
MTETATDYRLSMLSPADRGEALELMRLALGDSATTAKTDATWHWKHEANPFGASFVLGAHDAGGQLACLRVLMQWEFTAPGQPPACAVRPVDTATHPDHRRKGLFTTLTRQAVGEMEKRGAAFLFNTPNENSLPGYLKMGWSVVERWPVYGRPTRRLWRRALRLGQPAPASQPWAAFVAAHGAALGRVVARHEAGRPGAGYRTPRTMAYLAWRYCGPPGVPYEVVPHWEGDRLTGIVIGRVGKGFRGLPVFVIVEAFSADPTPAALATLFRVAARSVAADYVIAHFREGSAEYDGMRRAGFLRMPGRGYTFVARGLAGASAPDPARRESWDLTIGELELF